MAEASAWLLALDAEVRAAVGARELIHLVQFPTVFEIPDAPPHCRQVLLWQEEIVPVMDVAAWLRGGRAGAAPPAGRHFRLPGNPGKRGLWRLAAAGDAPAAPGERRSSLRFARATCGLEPDRAFLL
ncbi:MAG: chemotaxis protein CheW [Candidatus Competibacter sp.]